VTSKENFKTEQEITFNRYKGAAMKEDTKFVTKSIVFEENWKKPVSNETFEERAARCWPENIARAIAGKK
jgi:hypothetical protein